MNQRNKSLEDSKGDNQEHTEDWVTVVDFTTGQPKKVKKVKSI